MPAFAMVLGLVGSSEFFICLNPKIFIIIICLLLLLLFITCLRLFFSFFLILLSSFLLVLPFFPGKLSIQSPLLCTQGAEVYAEREVLNVQEPGSRFLTLLWEGLFKTKRVEESHQIETVVVVRPY